MCGRYTLEINADRIAAIYGLDDILDDLPPRYNVAPGQLVAVVGRKPDGKHRGLAKLHWGLVPRWANDTKKGLKPINARAETLREKPLFREAFEKRRCIIPASGFYEWKTTGRAKQAHLIRLRENAPMAFAGLWDVWGRGCERYASCCIITVAANELIKPLHDRMPAILPSAAFDEWLSLDTLLHQAEAWLTSFPADQMTVHPVGPSVNSVSNDTPECIAQAV